MPWFDLLILAILVVSILVSIARGFAKDAISLAAWILAFVIAISLTGKFASILPDLIENPRLRLVLAFLVLFIATLATGMLANFMLAGFINLTKAHNLDRGLGALFGFARGVVIICLIAVLGAFIGLNDLDWWERSAFLPMAENIVSYLAPMLPENVAELIKV